MGRADDQRRRCFRSSRSVGARDHSPATNSIHPQSALGMNICLRRKNPATEMRHKRLVKAAIVLGLGLNLLSCGGFVADHWPHWAGGMPDRVPPRPGTAGYAEFIAHGQAKREASPAETMTQNSTGETTAVQAPVTSAAQVGPVMPEDEHSRDTSVVTGGLY